MPATGTAPTTKALASAMGVAAAAAAVAAAAAKAAAQSWSPCLLPLQSLSCSA